MAKELPYFKFYVSEWILGRIFDQPDRVQGAFLVAVCHYWHKKCSVSAVDFKKKIGRKRFDLLLFNKFIEVRNERVLIPFLDEQFIELSNVQTKRVKGGLARAQQVHQHNVQHKTSYIDKEVDKEVDTEVEQPTEGLHPLQVYINKNLTNVKTISRQLTIQQCEQLLKKYSKEQIESILLAMENAPNIAVKSLSVYYTVVNWIGARKEREVKETGTPDGTHLKLKQEFRD